MKGTKLKENLRKTNKGITLIALIVTIIVLLLLAGVTIAMLTGENGILNQASRAKEKSIKGTEQEAVELAYSNALANKLKTGGSTQVTAADLNAELTINRTNATATDVAARIRSRI